MGIEIGKVHTEKRHPVTFKTKEGMTIRSMFGTTARREEIIKLRKAKGWTVIARERPELVRCANVYF